MNFGELVILAILLLGVKSNEDLEESITSELHLANYDLIDTYDDISQCSKNIILGTGNFKEKITAELQQGTMMRLQHESNIDLEGKVPLELERHWTLLTKSGDLLLQENDFKAFVEFRNTIEEVVLHSTIPCVKNDTNCRISKQDFDNILAKSRNPLELGKVWEAEQDLLVTHAPQFSDILQLVNKAYTPNGLHSPSAYWEMLCENENGYIKAKSLWNEILPLYKKLHAFVKTRLYNYYNLTSTSDLIPVYLLGSNFANDWTNIANIVLPHPYLYTEVNTELKYETVKDIFQAAESSTRTMGFVPQGADFLTNSIFNFSSCGAHIYSHCGSSKSEVVTCSKLGWTEYLNIYEAYMDVTLRSVDYQSFPRTQMRYSAVDEAVKGMASLFAITDLAKNNIIPHDITTPENDDKYNRRNTAILLQALRVLPKLSYYLVADTWRLEELQVNYNNITERWWKHRNGIQGVQGFTGLEPDYLADPYISSNKPYLSKFFGLFLQFQIIDYYQKYYGSENITISNAIGQDQNFKKFIKERPNLSWPELINTYFGIHEVSSTAFLEYFKPLEEYLDKAPKEQIIIPLTPNPKRKLHTISVVSNGLKGNNSTQKNDTAQDSVFISQNKLPPDSATTAQKVGVFAIVAVLIIGAIIVYLLLRRHRRTHQKLVINKGY